MIIDELGDLIEASSSAEIVMEDRESNDVQLRSRRVPTVILEKVNQALLQNEPNAVICGVDTFTRDNVKRFYESRLFSIRASNQERRLFGYIAVDVTERVAAEQALKESEEKYSNYINHAPFGVFVVNEEGQYIDVNPSASEITGYDRNNLLRMSVQDITAEESLVASMQAFDTLKQTGHLNTELKFIRADGATALVDGYCDETFRRAIFGVFDGYHRQKERRRRIDLFK